LAWLAPLVAPHAAGDDLLCAPLAARDAAPSLRPTTTHADQQPHHCVICHSARSHRTALSDLGPASVVLTPGHELAPIVTACHRTPALDGLPARAPPA
jgi:hypothetical protein